MFQVSLKPGHSTGTYRRAGLVFHASEPTFLKEIPQAILKDLWLSVSEADPTRVPFPSTGEDKGEGENAEAVRQLNADLNEAVEEIVQLRKALLKRGEEFGEVKADLQNARRELEGLKAEHRGALDTIATLEAQLAEAIKEKGKGKKGGGD